MKTLFFILASLMMAQVWAATPGSYICSGTDENGDKFQIHVSQAQKFIELKQLDKRVISNPPKYNLVKAWRLFDVKVTATKLVVSGTSLGYTTGRVGSITIEAKRSESASNFTYRGSAKIIPSTMRVLPATIAKIIPVICKSN